MLAVDLGTPEQPRLRSAPLRVAICQVRFPRLFGLSGPEIRPLARALYEAYPSASEDEIQNLQLEVSPQGLRPKGGHPVAAYRFESEDGNWTITLTQEWLAMETTAYSGFRDFAERWLQVITETREVVPIEEETRLGMRYVNELPVGPEVSIARLREVLTAEVVGPFNLDEDAEAVLRSWQELRFRHSEGGCTMQHGYVQNATEDWVYVLDFDGYREGRREMDLDEQVKAMASINHHIFKLFRKSITDELFETFEPEEQR